MLLYIKRLRRAEEVRRAADAAIAGDIGLLIPRELRAGDRERALATIDRAAACRCQYIYTMILCITHDTIYNTRSIAAACRCRVVVEDGVLDHQRPSCRDGAAELVRVDGDGAADVDGLGRRAHIGGAVTSVRAGELHGAGAARWFPHLAASDL